MATYDGNDFVKTVTQVGDAMHPDQVTQYDYDTSGTSLPTGLPTAVTDGEGKTTRYSYNGFGQVTSVTDPLMHTVTNTYDPQTGDLLSVQAPATSATDYRYDGAGNVTATSFGGATSQYMYDSVGHLTETVSPTGVHHTMMYDANGNRKEESFTWTDPDGVRPPRTLTTRMMYDANDRLTLTIDPEGKQTQYTYDALNRVKQTTDIYGGVSSTKYDKRGLVVEQTTPLGTVTRTAYDVDGRPEYVTDAFVPGGANDPPNGTHNYYDDAGRVERVERVHSLQVTITPAGTDLYTSALASVGAVYSTTRTVYNALGQVERTFDAANLQTKVEYNKRGQQIKEIAVINAVESCDATSQYCTQTDYDDAGRATLVTDRAHHPTQTDYDAAGRPKKVTYADSTFTQTGYDAQRRKQSQTDELGHATTFMYDTVGRLQSVIQPAVPDPERGGQSFMPTTNYEYDVFGNLKTIHDAKGRETWFAYDEYNRQVRRSLPPAGPGSQGTSSGGNMPTTLNDTRQTWQADQWKGFTVRIISGPGAGQEREVQSNSTNQLVLTAPWTTIPNQTSVYGIAAAEKTVYNDLGQLFQKLDFKGQKAQFEYDIGLNRVHFKKLFAAGAATPTEQVEYRYDPLGRIQHVIQPFGTTDYDYDTDSRLRTLTTLQGSLTYGYEEATGRHTSTETTNSKFVYGYDVFGHLQTVTVNKRDGAMLSTPEVTTYNWDPVGTLNNVQRQTSPTITFTTAFGYDLRYRVRSVVHQRTDSSIGQTVQLANYVYDRRLDGKIKHVDEYGSDASTRTAVLDYVYDDIGRLTRECTNAAAGACASAPGDHTDYSLDLVGNRLTKQTFTGTQSQTTTWHYNARDEIIDQIFSGGGTTSFDYDTNGSLTRTVSTTGDSANYQYNTETRLIGAQVVRGGTPQSTTYAYNDDGSRVQEGNISLLVDPNNPTGFTQVMEEHDSSSGALLTTYVYGLEPLSFSRPGTPGQPGPSWQYVTDAHSGVRIVVNASGAADATYRYDAFGNYVGQPGTFTNVVQFQGQRFDAVLGQDYFRARIYDPATGRFTGIERDLTTIDRQVPHTLHRYAYVHGDPINFSDPSGLIEVGGLIGLLGSLRIQLNLRVINAQIVTSAYLAAHPTLATLITYGFTGLTFLSIVADPGQTIALGPTSLINDAALFATATQHAVDSAFAIIKRPDSLNRASGVLVRLTRAAVDSSRGSAPSVDPTGWAEFVAMTQRQDRARGHLLARWFGGSGQLPENLVPLYQSANLRMKNIVETRVATELQSGRYEAVIYRVTPVYEGANLIPKALTIEAVGQDANGGLSSIYEGSIFNQR